jgi:hypothetical protein
LGSYAAAIRALSDTIGGKSGNYNNKIGLDYGQEVNELLISDQAQIRREVEPNCCNAE